MMKSSYFIKLATVIVSLATSIVCADAAQKSNSSVAKIKKAIIKESIEQYPGNCPCPYNTARNGSRCGRRSAYSRPGGYAPVCYASDVTQDMVKVWRENHLGR
jgi:hypothetical protein